MAVGINLPAQIRLYGAFFVYSLALGAIYPRIGDIQLALGMGEAALGTALIGPGVGTLISLTFGNRFIEKVGARLTALFGIILLSSLMAFATFMSTAVLLFFVLFGAGLAIGAIEVVLNVEADRVEHQVGRRIMSRCHAFWSFGFFSAGIVGAVAKQLEIPPQVHLSAMVPVIAIAAFFFIRHLQPAEARSATDVTEAPKFATPSLGILVLVAFTLSSMFLEGAGADWSVIFMRDTFSASPFINVFAFAIGALTQAITRFFADGFVDRFGPKLVARLLVLILGAGTIIVTTSQGPYIALIGFALMGVGTSAMFPLAMSAAAQRTDRPAAVNVAALAQTSFVAFLVGPPLLGVVAEHFGLRTSFMICLPLVVMSWFAISALTPKADSTSKPHG